MKEISHDPRLQKGANGQLTTWLTCNLYKDNGELTVK